MKSLIFTICMVCLLSTVNAQSDHSKNQMTMKLNAGIITDKLVETKAFYVDHLGFGVSFENDFYLLLHTPNHQAEIAFFLPNHPSQTTPVFRNAYEGRGIYFTIEIEDVDQLYKEIKSKGLPIEIALKNEVWGDRHFSIVDPNGIGIDFVKYTAPIEN